eukprot:scaffold16606_cov58-Phaeocystis_antarctica.AAC.3
MALAPAHPAHASSWEARGATASSASAPAWVGGSGPCCVAAVAASRTPRWPPRLDVKGSDVGDFGKARERHRSISSAYKRGRFSSRAYRQP